MIRDGLGFVLLGIAVMLGLVAWFLVRSERVSQGVWWSWPLSLTWRLAGLFVSLGLLLGVIGLLTMSGDGPVAWWGIALVANVAVWALAFWWEWGRHDRA